jgi:hypothetical protein
MTISNIDKTFNTNDKRFIKQLKKTIINSFNEWNVQFDETHNTFVLTKNNSLLENSVSESEKITESFFQDLMSYNLTTPQFYYDWFLHDDCKNLFCNLYSSTDKYSDYLKYSIYQLSNTNHDEFFNLAIQHLHYQNRVDIILDMLKKGRNYYTSEDDHSTNQKKFSHFMHICYLLRNIPNMEKAFCEHIKNSSLILEESELIKEYTWLFSKEHLSQLYESLNMKREDLFLNIEDKVFATINLSVKTLMENNLELKDINQICDYLNNTNQIDFPSFFVIEHNSNSIVIAFDSKDNSKNKIMMFLNQVAQKQYKIQMDDEYSVLQSLITQINEVSHLDNVIKEDNETFNNNEGKKIKIKL